MVGGLARVALATAARGLLLKAAALGAVLLFFALLLLGGMALMGGDGTAMAAGCERGLPQTDVDGHEETQEPEGAGPGAEQRNRQRQMKNAEIIDGVARANDLSGRATLVALMTALQESQLLNIDYGDRDSVGLFQQRPSQGWGGKSQLLKPKYAAHKFFQGGKGGSPRGLVDIKNWEKKELGDAAQAVQRSAYPDLYAGQEDKARDIAEAADIDLERQGKADAGDVSPDTEACGTQPDGAESQQPGGESGNQKPFRDGRQDWPQRVENPRSAAEAINWAQKEADSGGKDWYRMCLAFVAQAYGYRASGVQYAIDHYRSEMPKEMKNDGDRNPPKGALMYWDTGERAGHVAIYIGDGKIASNDIKRPGYIDIAPATAPEEKWGASYVGWAPPYFPKGA